MVWQTTAIAAGGQSAVRIEHLYKVASRNLEANYPVPRAGLLDAARGRLAGETGPLSTG
jgi:hypothetical protein